MRNVITTGDVPLGGVLEVLRGTIVTPSARELARDRGVPIVEAHVHAHETLAGVHRDPFDRMLVAQAAAEGMVIVTRDPLIQQYDVPTLW